MRLRLPGDPPTMFYFVSIACYGHSFESFPTLAKAQQYINDEMAASGFDFDDVEVIKGYPLKTRDLRTVEILDVPMHT